MKSIDFDKPASLSLICLHNGTAVVMKITEPQCSNLKTAEEFIDSLKFKYQGALNDRRAIRWREKQAKKEIVLEELKNLILSDSKFIQCTNQSSRHSYIKELLNSTDYSRFRDAFIGEFGSVIWYDAKNFVDALYRELKNSKKQIDINSF